MPEAKGNDSDILLCTTVAALAPATLAVRKSVVVKVVNTALTAFDPACKVVSDGTIVAVVVDIPTTFIVEASPVAVVVVVASASLPQIIVTEGVVVSVYFSVETKALGITVTVCVMTVGSGVAEITLSVEVVPRPLLALANISAVVLATLVVAPIGVNTALPIDEVLVLLIVVVAR